MEIFNKNIRLFNLLLYLTFNYVLCEEISFTPVIKTKYGELRGFYHSVPGYPTVAQYRGIPYATPPTGANRFSPTRAISQWKGIKDATTFGPACPQLTNDSLLQAQSEDCLYLNLYVPASGTSTLYLCFVVFIQMYL